MTYQDYDIFLFASSRLGEIEGVEGTGQKKQFSDIYKVEIRFKAAPNGQPLVKLFWLKQGGAQYDTICYVSKNNLDLLLQKAASKITATIE
jgi:hypothetical protein